MEQAMMEGAGRERGRIRERETEKEGGGEGEQGRAHSPPHGFPGNMAHRLLEAHKRKSQRDGWKSFVNRFKPA